jgi:hypothetical protein
MPSWLVATKTLNTMVNHDWHIGSILRIPAPATTLASSSSSWRYGRVYNIAAAIWQPLVSTDNDSSLHHRFDTTYRHAKHNENENENDSSISSISMQSLPYYMRCPWRALHVVWYQPMDNIDDIWMYCHDQHPSCIRAWQVEMVDNNHSLSRYVSCSNQVSSIPMAPCPVGK